MPSLARLAAISWACAFRRATSFGVHAPMTMRVLPRRYATGKGKVEGPITGASESLCDRARKFLQYKNAAGRGESTLDPVFEMCSQDVDLYGLKGEDVRPGFIDFFEGHKGLQHELIEEPTQVRGSRTVQYPFVKTWQNENGETQRWASIDPAKPRNKVERLDFDDEGKLVRVSVVEATAPLAPLQL